MLMVLTILLYLVKLPNLKNLNNMHSTQTFQKFVMSFFDQCTQRPKNGDISCLSKEN